MSGKKNKTLLVIAIGCGVLVLLAGIAVAVGGFFIVKEAKKIEANAKNPEQAAKDVLGAESFPPGYYPKMAFSLLGFYDLAILADTPGSLSDEEGNRQGIDREGNVFLYFNFYIPGGKERQELLDFFEGRSEDTRVLTRNNINVNPKTIISRGKMDLNGGPVAHLTFVGDVNTSSKEYSNTREDALTTLFWFDCGDSKKRMRVGIWMVPNTLASFEEGTTPDLTGTIGDPEVIQQFLAYFDMCK